MENNPQNAASEKDQRPVHLNDRREMTNGADGNYPNKLADKNGLGSPYGGTQSPDSKAPDGNQSPANPDAEGKSTKHPDLGEEYEDPSSYGEPQSGGKEGDQNGGTDAAGSPIR